MDDKTFENRTYPAEDKALENAEVSVKKEADTPISPDKVEVPAAPIEPPNTVSYKSDDLESIVITLKESGKVDGVGVPANMSEKEGNTMDEKEVNELTQKLSESGKKLIETETKLSDSVKAISDMTSKLSAMEKELSEVKTSLSEKIKEEQVRLSEDITELKVKKGHLSAEKKTDVKKSLSELPTTQLKILLSEAMALSEVPATPDPIIKGEQKDLSDNESKMIELSQQYFGHAPNKNPDLIVSRSL